MEAISTVRRYVYIIKILCRHEKYSYSFVFQAKVAVELLELLLKNGIPAEDIGQLSVPLHGVMCLWYAVII